MPNEKIKQPSTSSQEAHSIWSNDPTVNSRYRGEVYVVPIGTKKQDTGRNTLKPPEMYISRTHRLKRISMRSATSSSEQEERDHFLKGSPYHDFHTKGEGGGVKSLNGRRSERRRSKLVVFTSFVWKKLRNFLPCVALILYSAIGGFLFSNIEGPQIADTTRQKILHLQQAINTTTYDLLAYVREMNDIAPSGNQSEELIEFYKTKLRGFAEELGLQPKGIFEWDYWESVFYAGTLYTTIGYGSIAPATIPGKALTMIYAILGIPLVLYTLSEMGKFFCFTIWKLYTLFYIYIFNRCCPRYKKGDEELAEFPFTLAVTITFGWMFLCSTAFVYWEEWDYFTSFYFFFQSLTTIGLGDITPHHSQVFGFFLIIIGMALVSMCWNLVQIKLDRLVQQTMGRIQETVLNEMDAENEEGTPEGGAEGGAKSPSNIKAAVERIAATENNWLATLLSESRKSTLVSEWQHQARHRHRRIQTDFPHYAKETQTDFDVNEASVQTGKMYYEDARGRQKLPLKEVQRHLKPSHSADEFVGLLKQLGYILNDCRDIVRSESGHSGHSGPSGQT